MRLERVRNPGCRRPGHWAGLAFWFAAAGCGHGTPSAYQGETAEPPPVVVTVAPLERRAMERTIGIEGTLKAWEEVTISAKQGGRVVKVLHDMGDRVSPGAVLVELDPTDARLAWQQAEAKYLAELSKLGITREQAEAFVSKYGISERIYQGEEATKVIDELPATRQARASLAKARNELTRQEGLYNRGVGTMQDLQNTQDDFKMAEAALADIILTARSVVANALTARAALDVAEQELADMTIRTPIPSALPPGTSEAAQIVYAVTRRAVHEGQRLKDGEAVMDLVIEDPIRLWANVPERFRPEVEVGQRVRITAQSRPGQVFEGSVSRINPAVDPASRSFQVEAIIPNPDGRLGPGGFAKGEIILRSDAQAVVVPLESVYRFAGVTKIYLVEGDRAVGYPVQVGRELNNLAEVVGDPAPLPTEGLVVTTGQTVLAKLAEGTRVEVRTPEPEVDTETIRKAQAVHRKGEPSHASPTAAPKGPQEASAQNGSSQ